MATVQDKGRELIQRGAGSQAGLYGQILASFKGGEWERNFEEKLQY
jgi:hypothetical protein